MYSIRNANTRQALIEATSELLWERGYGATSPKEILRRAGAGQGSMYHHFAGKEELARAAFERNSALVWEKAVAGVSRDGPAADRLIGYLRLPREALLGCPVGRMAGDAEVMASPALHDVLAGIFDRLRTLMADAVADGVRAGEFVPGVLPDELADTVLAVVQGGYTLARAAGDPAPFDRAVRGAVALIENARTDRQEHP